MRRQVAVRIKDAALMTGVKLRELTGWCDKGVIVVANESVARTNMKREFDWRSLLQVRIVKELLDAGMSLRGTRRIMDTIRHDLTQPEWIAKLSKNIEIKISLAGFS